MENIYIKATDLNRWIAKYFPKQDLISVADLIACIEELDGEVEYQKEEYKHLENNVEENYRRIPSGWQY